MFSKKWKSKKWLHEHIPHQTSEFVQFKWQKHWFKENNTLQAWLVYINLYCNLYSTTTEHYSVFSKLIYTLCLNKSFVNTHLHYTNDIKNKWANFPCYQNIRYQTIKHTMIKIANILHNCVFHKLNFWSNTCVLPCIHCVLRSLYSIFTNSVDLSYGQVLIYNEAYFTNIIQNKSKEPNKSSMLFQNT